MEARVALALACWCRASEDRLSVRSGRCGYSAETTLSWATVIQLFQKFARRNYRVGIGDWPRRLGTTCRNFFRAHANGAKLGLNHCRAGFQAAVAQRREDT